MAVALDDVRAYTKVTSMSLRGRNPYAYVITGLYFPNLSDDLVKTVGENQTSEWQAYFIQNAERFASQAYAKGNSPKCSV
ncbi:unnamed protein product [Dibothriocephalus latus]|uniref:Uncharacterized protein n=1 Tax=Dibothriocephalus latus TaxID=60516 RepID=A0A3P7QEU1_DIBLA|nr:unnamed protein product [Dibothriocephalus latus]